MASSIGAIKKQIQRDVQNAMNEARNKTSEKLDDNILGYYDRGDPEQYIREGILIDASNVTPVSGGGDSYEFKAEMDASRMSHSSHGTFSEDQILEATETGFYGGTLGKHAFWQKTRLEIPSIVAAAFSKRFR